MFTEPVRDTEVLIVHPTKLEERGICQHRSLCLTSAVRLLWLPPKMGVLPYLAGRHAMEWYMPTGSIPCFYNPKIILLNQPC
jgi:hypothetical protein